MALPISAADTTTPAKTDRIHLIHASITAALRTKVFSIALLVSFILFPSQPVFASPFAEPDTPTAAQVIKAVNTLRENNGLSPLNVHSVLMQVAQTEADGIANGMPGHWRPNGLTLGQWLVSLGYPLAGDLSLDGFRSENWWAARTAAEAIQAWQGDAEHSNTMLSPDRSDIGVGIASGGSAAGDQTYIVLLTALQTSSGKMQTDANPLLTQVASSGGAASGSLISQYIKPVILSTARPDGNVVHKIQYGQTLWSLAVAYHTTIDQIRAWNNLGQESTVYEGQYMLVQMGATQPPPATLTPRPSPTPHNTANAPQATSSPTATLLPSSPSPGESLSFPNSPNQNQIVIILVLVALGGLVAAVLTQKKD
jgi:uncharacterized protein YkwD